MELTRSAELNQLIRMAQDWQLGIVTPDDVKNSLRQMETVYKTMYMAWQSEQKRYEKTAPIWQESPQLEAAFRRLRQGLEEIRLWHRDLSPSRLANGINDACVATDELFACFDRLQEREAGTPRLSSNPFLHEVIRIGHLVLEGKLGVEVLADVLPRMKFMLKQTGQQMFAQTLEGDAGETQKQARKLMDRIYAGLKEAEAYLTDRHADRLRKGLDAARQAMEELYQLKEKTENPPPAVEFRACWRCGDEVPGDQMTCGKCGFRFPTEAPGVDVMAQAPRHRTPVGHTASEASEALSAAVEDVQEGAPFDTLLPALQETRGRLLRARNELAKAPPALGADATMMEDDAMALQQGLDLMEQGLARIEKYGTEPDPSHLSEGLELYLVGNDQVIALQDRGEEASEPHV